nr:hypothetical protein [Tanacetum cinerariifolium]
MSITKEQQQAWDEAFVRREQCLTIGSCNYRLSIAFKPKEPTFQVALDVLSLTPFYPAFLITANYLTTQAMKESEAYKTYHDLATGKVQPKPKYVHRSSRSKTEQEPKPFPGKSVKATAKVAKLGKKNQPALGLETLTEVALTYAEQLKLATKRSLFQTYSSHASGSGAHEGIGVKPGVPDVPTTHSDEEEISWKSSDEEDDDDEPNIGKDEDDNGQEDDDDNTNHVDDSKRTNSDNDGDDFVHPKFSTHDDEASHGMNVKGDELDDEGANEEDDGYCQVGVDLCEDGFWVVILVWTVAGGGRK